MTKYDDYTDPELIREKELIKKEITKRKTYKEENNKKLKSFYQ